MLIRLRVHAAVPRSCRATQSERLAHMHVRHIDTLSEQTNHISSPGTVLLQVRSLSVYLDSIPTQARGRSPTLQLANMMSTLKFEIVA